MNKVFSSNRFVPFGLVATLILGACSQEPETAAQSSTGADSQAQQDNSDVIARVENESITFSEISVMLNSAAVVGLSVPALGTPERDTVRITLLDKFVDANLIYLDALRKGVDKEAQYQRDTKRISNGMLADLYVKQQLGDVSVSDEEIETYFKNSVVPGTEFTAEARAQIESVLRKQKTEANKANSREQLREGVDIKIYQENFQLEGDDERSDDVVVAVVGEEKISWGEIGGMLIAAGVGALHKDLLAMEMDARLDALQLEIDTRLMAQKARAAGLDKDPVYQARLNEYRKTRLINIHRANLAQNMQPSDEQLEEFFNANRSTISIPEFRKVQMVVLATEDEAKDIKRRVETGEMTMYEAASRHSITPDAKKDLGEIGWVQKDKVLPALQDVVFSLGPGEIGGPIQVGDTWHLMTVLDVRDAQRESLDEAATRKEARRKYVHAKINEYTVNLRKNDFKVEVYQDRIVQLAQQEADMVGKLAEKAQEPGSVTQQRLEDLQKLLEK
jgi:parvulin-like peptidyl-prolyl isomerase